MLERVSRPKWVGRGGYRSVPIHSFEREAPAGHRATRDDDVRVGVWQALGRVLERAGLMG